MESLGAGEILLTSIDMDGTKDGYDVDLTKKIVNSVSIPVVASGGCGKPEDMIDVFKKTDVEAALAASIFHYETHSVNRVKKLIKESGIPVRI
jgi:cyclase